jgi:hypothetical protein
MNRRSNRARVRRRAGSLHAGGEPVDGHLNHAARAPRPNPEMPLVVVAAVARVSWAVACVASVPVCPVRGVSAVAFVLPAFVLTTSIVVAVLGLLAVVRLVVTAPT